MTEVGVAMHTDPPESTESNIAIPINNGEQLKGQQDNNIKENADKPVAMEVDGVEAEEDDSQITSSTENGNKNCIETTKRSPITSAESSKISAEPDSTPIKTDAATGINSATVDENSSNACDSVSRNCDSISENPNYENHDSVPSQADGVPADDDADADADATRLNDNREHKPSTVSNKIDSEIVSQDKADAVKILNNDEVPSSSIDKDTTLHVSSKSPTQPINLSRNASPIEEVVQPTPLQKENGVVVKTEKARADTSVVNLDDTDEEMESVPRNQVKRAENSNCGSVQSMINQQPKDMTKARSICSDSDGAVVIGSDSENESGLPPINNSVIKPPDLQVIDDDDDCVVIEDDSPAPTANDLSKRKCLAMDSPSNSDDSQPPTKRQRNSGQVNFNQIAIKDARSLMPQEAMAKRLMDGGVYPVNITPAMNLAQGPPKLVPVSNVPHLPLGGMPGMSANLLPGLTDDMFVLEAPSFIVPYIYEKPPSDNLSDVIKEIESKYKLTKEDLAEADKSDEFDMMTEQNKDEKEEKTSKKKKKRRGGDDGDESWSEETEEDDEDDDDDDSESGMRTKVLIKEASDDLTALKGAIKPASAVVQSQSPSYANKPGQENYFESPLGKFFMDIGVGLVQEYVQSDLIRLQKRKMRKSLGKNITEFERAIAALSGNLEASKKKNNPFKFTMKRCEFCNFKSESALAMANHYETPHMNGPHYKCNFCTFEIRNATEIVYHMEAVHNIKARLIKPLPYHQCPNCGFEDNGKAKLARHQPVCAKKFRPELNLAPPNDWEAPAKIPRIKPRHGLVGTATAYQAMAAQAAAQKAALASIQQQQQQVAQARNLQAAALAAQNAANKIRGRPPVINKQGPNGGAAVFRGPTQVRNPVATTIVMPNAYPISSGQLTQTPNIISKKALTGQPSISITPLPRQSALPAQTSPSTSKMPQTGMKPGQNPSGSKTQFVICEICDGYIKDLEQLRNHMQWMHKVKIHPKMIYNRPPLNCQKCQFRFFTDQGLERHLLGSHGLVTSSMQEAANKGKDAGRCPVCGRMYQWKLLNHVSRDHHMTLKPAHLSYKCTVCTATFGMYKQFETHVYTAHSTVAKKAMDGKKNNSVPNPTASSGSSGITQRSSLTAANDSLLKPLKINDEITIIPQPASKPRITNMESHVID